MGNKESKYKKVATSDKTCAICNSREGTKKVEFTTGYGSAVPPVILYCNSCESQAKIKQIEYYAEHNILPVNSSSCIAHNTTLIVRRSNGKLDLNLRPECWKLYDRQTYIKEYENSRGPFPYKREGKNILLLRFDVKTVSIEELAVENDWMYRLHDDRLLIFPPEYPSDKRREFENTLQEFRAQPSPKRDENKV